MRNDAAIPSTPDIVRLCVWFDVDQISSSLGYELVVVPSTPPDPNPRFGRRACSLYFVWNEQMQLDVAGYIAKDSKFATFRILECCLVTRPQLVLLAQDGAMAFAAPSPFAQTNRMASYRLPLDFSEKKFTYPDGNSIVTQTWQHHLDVCDQDGRWEMSFLLMVSVEPSDGTAAHIRVFTFDPETEVGGIIRCDPLNASGAVPANAAVTPR